MKVFDNNLNIDVITQVKNIPVSQLKIFLTELQTQFDYFFDVGYKNIELLNKAIYNVAIIYSRDSIANYFYNACKAIPFNNPNLNIKLSDGYMWTVFIYNSNGSISINFDDLYKKYNIEDDKTVITDDMIIKLSNTL